MSLFAIRIALAIGAVCASVVAADGVTTTPSGANAEKKGYWWGQRDKDEEPAEQAPEHPDLAAPPSEDKLLAMYPADLEKMIEQYRDFALWKMTPEHVAWYYQLQDFARRRSQAFMNQTQVVMLTQGKLNMNAEYPETTPGITAHAAQAQDDTNHTLAAAADSAAIILLTRKSCGYCAVQRNTLTYFQQAHPGWDVREFDVDEQPAVKARFSVEATPTTVVIFKGSSQWFPVAVGVESVTGVEQNVARALRLLEGETDPSQFTLQTYQQGGLLDPQREAK